MKKVKYGLEPSLEKALHRYHAVINNKMHERKLKSVSLTRLVGAILTHFLSQNKDRIFNEFNFLLARTAKRSLRSTFSPDELEAFGLSEVPDDEGTDGRTPRTILGHSSAAKRALRKPNSRRSKGFVPSNLGKPRKIPTSRSAVGGKSSGGEEVGSTIP